jgi:ABC-type bacteriocin/lantibiotic exporter with double-glycine peptidase domain
MITFRRTILPILLATIWISVSEFARNEFMLKSYWTDHYEKLGLIFPSEPINGAMWGLWSLLFAVAIYIIAQKFTLIQTTFFSWFIGFVLMWVVVSNLGVLPDGLLIIAVPLSLLEAFIAAFIIHKLKGSSTVA